jgi:hypothetical protein
MDFKLELVAIPVTDIDRAKSFYADKVGFDPDHDVTVSDEIRFVQLTPRGSACSIALGKGLVESAPGSLEGLQLVVSTTVGPQNREDRSTPPSEAATASHDGHKPTRAAAALGPREIPDGRQGGGTGRTRTPLLFLLPGDRPK